MENAIITVALIGAVLGYVLFRQYFAHHRRIMIHRERMVALEKGIDLPPVEQEVRRSNVNVQRILLLAGLIWISLGIATWMTLNTLLASEPAAKFIAEGVPPGIQYVAIAPVGIGIAHLVALAVGRKKD
jgi:hypothetical protein